MKPHLEVEDWGILKIKERIARAKEVATQSDILEKRRYFIFSTPAPDCATRTSTKVEQTTEALSVDHEILDYAFVQLHHGPER